MPKAVNTKHFSISLSQILIAGLLLLAVLFTCLPDVLAQNQNAGRNQNTLPDQNKTLNQDTLPGQNAAPNQGTQSSQNTTLSQNTLPDQDTLPGQNTDQNPVTSQNQSAPQAECQILDNTFSGLGSGINLDSKMKRPMIMFRETLNKRWRPIPVFLTVFLLALIVRLLPSGLRSAAIHSTRSALLPSLSYALVFCAVSTVLTRLAFQFKSTVPLALLSLGILELFFFIGMGLAVNLLGDRLCELLSDKTFPKDSKQRQAMGALILLGASMLIAALAIIPGLGHLPRLGNRLLVFLAMLGSGGLLRALYKRYDQADAQK